MTPLYARQLTLASGAVLPNRIAKSAMSERLAAPDGTPNGLHLRLYERWSRGGAGLLVTGNVFVGRDAIGESGNVYVDHDGDASASAGATRVRTIQTPCARLGVCAANSATNPGRNANDQ